MKQQTRALALGAIVLLVVILSVTLSPKVQAEQGDILFRAGAHSVMPKSDNHDIVEVEDATMLTFNLTYFFTSHFAVEVLAALPFEHDVELVSGGTAARVKHLPPTVSAQYHFNPAAKIRPYVGVGLNVTEFFEEDTTGPLAGAELKLDTSIGAALQLGVDIDLSEQIFLNAEVRYIGIETDAHLNGARLGTIEIDPWAIGINLGFQF